MCFDKNFLLGLVILICVFNSFNGLRDSLMPCNVSTNKSCPASIYYVPISMKTIEETASLFHVNVNAVKKSDRGFLIIIHCGCQHDRNVFSSNLDYMVQPGDTWQSLSVEFGSFVVKKPDKVLVPLRIVTLDLLCGCSEIGYLVTYEVQARDTLFTICSRFNADSRKTVSLNRIENPNIIYDGEILFIPEPDLRNLTLVDIGNKEPKTKRASTSKTDILIGAVAAAVTVLLLSITLIFWKIHRRKRSSQSQQTTLSSRKMDCWRCNFDSCPYHTISEDICQWSPDKPTVFPYNQIRDATSNFSMASKIGQGSCGSVYLGYIRGTNVAIKQMKNTKSKEFSSEINILCKVHHSNLIELLGYAAGGDSFFLVYEYAENGALSDHLHRHSSKGYQPLPWIRRVHIALDAAQGLEYIHEYTKPYYVHRDVKTSNILLDSNFRAKIADFGLVKLLEKSPDVGATAASRIVGTFGYLAPEYARDGCVSTKIDVYAFGVVLMELLTGQPALSKDDSSRNDPFSEHRSVVQYVTSALNDTEDPFAEFTKCIDPNLTYYHEDSLFQMALLSKDCVDDDWKRRPDMCKVVLRLSEILISTEKWVS